MSVSLFNLEKQMEAYAPYHMNKMYSTSSLCSPKIIYLFLNQ
jgi:hypothetical protein